MPGASRVGDYTLCWETVENERGEKECIPLENSIASGSPNVFINGRHAAKVGSTTTHPCTVVSGSATVFINSSHAARIGDLLSCFCGTQGHITGGSTNVFIGG